MASWIKVLAWLLLGVALFSAAREFLEGDVWPGVGALITAVIVVISLATITAAEGGIGMARKKGESERYLMTFAGRDEAPPPDGMVQMVMEIPAESAHKFPPDLRSGDTMNINGYSELRVAYIRRMKRNGFQRIYIRLEEPVNG